MKKSFQNNLWLVFVSVLIAFFLFLTAYATNNNRGSVTDTGAETYSHTLTNVPIDIKYDSDKYFISGYSYETQVYLTSTNRIKLDSEINSNTRKFKVVADLSDFEEGTAEVPLEVTNLPDGVSAKVTPSQISVTIGKKTSKTFKVQGKVQTKQIGVGYELSKVTTSLEEVTVTSDESTINQIDHVEAALPEDEILTANYSGRVSLQAVTADGTIVAGVIDPAKANLYVTVRKITKTVPIHLNVTGTMSDQVSGLDYQLSQETAVVSGTKDSVESVSQVEATIDVSGIEADETKKITLTPIAGVTIEPTVIEVKVKVSKK